MRSRRPPFRDEPHAVLVLPREDTTLGGEAALLELEKAELEIELGTAVQVSTTDPGAGARWLLVLDPDHEGPSTLTFEPEERLIVSRAADVGGLFEAFSLWRTASRAGGGSAAASDCEDVEQAIERVTVEVGDTYPSFELHGVD